MKRAIIVFHGLPEEGIKAIDSIFKDYTEEEINQLGDYGIKQLLRFRVYATNKVFESSDH
jgi:hypothetical protein